MTNKKFYPFERNNYFFGKLLTVRDFEDEQKYMNDKRRITNLFSIGAGVVSGLDVVAIDDKNLSVESGMAIDYLGREIIVEDSTVKRLNLMDGFDSVKDKKDFYLCISYMETEKEEVHSITQSSVEKDSMGYNRIKEGYRLFLTGEAPYQDILTLNYLFEDKKTVFHDQGIKIEQTIPRFANADGYLEIKIDFSSIGITKPVEFGYSLESDYFTSSDSKKEIPIAHTIGADPDFRKETIIVKALADRSRFAQAKINIIKDSFFIKTGSLISNSCNDIECSVEITTENIKKRLLKEYYKSHFNTTVNSAFDLNIYLARISIISFDKSFIIENVERMPFNQYAVNNPLLYLISNIEDDKRDVIQIQASELNSLKKDELHHCPYEISTGAQTIDLELNTKNKSFFSSETAHGLGLGEVCINTSISYGTNKKHSLDESYTLSGSSRVFINASFNIDVPDIEIGVISYPEKGTFRIGVRFNEPVREKRIKVYWMAIKPTVNQNKSSLNEAAITTISIEPNILTIKPRGKHKFNAIIEGTENKGVRWQVEGRDAGKIDENGIYEAPNKEGVFEIKAESMKHPSKKTNAYVVVKSI